MSELGAGGGSGYPGAIDTDNTLESTSTSARSDVPNDLAAAIIAIQTELGVNPAGYLTVSGQEGGKSKNQIHQFHIRDYEFPLSQKNSYWNVHNENCFCRNITGFTITGMFKLETLLQVTFISQEISQNLKGDIYF